MSSGTVTCGAVVSLTVIVNEDEPVFPWASVAVQSTLPVPSGNMGPDDGLQNAATGPFSVSVAPADDLTVARPEPVASTRIGRGVLNARRDESAMRHRKRA